jgi:AmmeMemoRadiSam system protein B
MFYPGSNNTLTSAVDGYLADSDPPELENVRAVIAPHAGYIYSGPTAGYAYKALQSSLPVGRTIVYLLGPSHRAWFDGVSTGDFESFATPLGDAPVDEEGVRNLWALKTHYQALPAAHQGEHCLEVQVPFLQRTIDQFSLVPLLFGDVDARAVGQELAGRLHDEPDARVVVSSDLSHFENYETAKRMDQSFLQDVLAGNSRAVVRNQRGACGRAPVAALMEIAAQLGWTSHLLDYRNSGDTAGDKLRVVGYAAVAYTAREQT